MPASRVVSGAKIPLFKAAYYLTAEACAGSITSQTPDARNLHYAA